MYVNAKMIPVENVPGMGGIKQRGGGVNSSMIYLIHCKKLYKCHNVPPYTPSTTIKKKKNNAGDFTITSLLQARHGG
jgi:acyl CoA:acetate/3-ketoacid CoA transferase beta subunit